MKTQLNGVIHPGKGTDINALICSQMIQHPVTNQVTMTNYRKISNGNFRNTFNKLQFSGTFMGLSGALDEQRFFCLTKICSRKSPSEIKQDKFV